MTQIALLVRDDLALSAAANDVLTLNSTVPSSVGATAKNGDITLTGTMRDRTEQAAAELLAAGLTGVRWWGAAWRSAEMSDDMINGEENKGHD
jgi:hypothetical protein